MKNRWGPSAWLKWFKGELLPGDDNMFMPEGFLTKDLGPKAFMGKGEDEMKVEVRRLQEGTNGACPLGRCN